MQSSIHMHSTLNGKRISCTATALTNFWDTERTYPTFGTWNDAFFPVRQVFDKILNKGAIDSDFTQADWTQEENSQVYSATGSHYQDQPQESEFKATYNFTSCVTCINRDTTGTWTMPKVLQFQCQIILDRQPDDTDTTYANRLVDGYRNCYKQFVRSVWPTSSATFWNTHLCSEYFQITCVNCNIQRTDEAILGPDTYDATGNEP